MANQRATTISIKQLTGAVEKAVAAAKGAQFEGPITYIPNWQLLGRILRAEIAQAEQVANQVTQSLNQQLAAGGAQEHRAAGAATGGGSFEPAVIWNGHHIICGARPAPQVELQLSE
jgi:hypothetical protein